MKQPDCVLAAVKVRHYAPPSLRRAHDGLDASSAHRHHAGFCPTMPDLSPTVDAQRPAGDSYEFSLVLGLATAMSMRSSLAWARFGGSVRQWYSHTNVRVDGTHLRERVVAQ